MLTSDAPNLPQKILHQAQHTVACMAAWHQSAKLCCSTFVQLRVQYGLKKLAEPLKYMYTVKSSTRTLLGKRMYELLQKKKSVHQYWPWIQLCICVQLPALSGSESCHIGSTVLSMCTHTQAPTTRHKPSWPLLYQHHYSRCAYVYWVLMSMHLQFCQAFKQLLFGSYYSVSQLAGAMLAHSSTLQFG